MNVKMIGMSIVLAFAMTGVSALGTPYIWDGPADGNWSSPENWNPDALPGTADTLTINGKSTVVDQSFTVNTLTTTGVSSLNGSGTLTATSITNSGTGAILTINNNLLTPTAGTTTLIATTSGSIGPMTVNGSITGTNLSLRGGTAVSEVGIVNGQINLNGILYKNDKVIWTITNANNNIPTFVNYRSTLKLGALNALDADGQVDVVLGQTNYGGTIELNGFNQTVKSVKLSTGTNVSGIITNSSATTSTFTVNCPENVVYRGTLTGNLGLTKRGDGRLDLWGMNTFTGDVHVYDGAGLYVDTPAAMGNPSNIVLHDENPTIGTSIHRNFTVGAGRALKGDGNLYGDITIEGTISPGINGVGTLTFGNASVVRDLALNGTYGLDVTTAGGSDLLKIFRNLNLGASSVLTIANPDELVFGNSYTIVDYDGTLTGTFSANNLPAGWFIDYGTGTNSMIMLVPEPASFAFACFGGLFGWLGRKHKIC